MSDPANLVVAATWDKVVSDHQAQVKLLEEESKSLKQDARRLWLLDPGDSLSTQKGDWRIFDRIRRQSDPRKS
jgi:hypothetical protein